MEKIKFVPSLPESSKQGHTPPEFWDALKANPGQWAEYPSSPKAIYYAAGAHSKNGLRFEARQYDGVGYVRCVKS